MSRPVLAAWLLPGVCAIALAQDPAAPPAQQDPEAAYTELARSFGKAMNDWYTKRTEAIAAAEAAGEAPPASVMQPPTKEFVERAAALAAQFAGKDAAVPFLTFVVKNASNERRAVKQAVQTLAAHAKSPAIRDALGHLGKAVDLGARRGALALLDDVIANNADAGCKAAALLSRGGIRLRSNRDDEQEAGVADLREVANVTDDEDLKSEASEALYEIDHLSVGCTAPDIDGVDVDGVPFKLSDYRGKVVLLDFWGFW